jgi:hypothetical protein
MNYYHVWCNLIDGSKDVTFCRAVDGYLGHLQHEKLIEGFRITRRKFGFGPSELGEFHIEIRLSSLAQLDTAFGVVATRTGTVESLHHAVYSLVKDFSSALYRDFPDPQRDPIP